MRIKLVKEYEGQPIDSVIEIADEQGNALIKEGHILFTDAVDKQEQEVEVKNLKEEIKMTIETKEMSKEIVAPNIIVKDAKRIESLADMTSKMVSEEVKSFELQTKAPAGLSEGGANGSTYTAGGYLVSHDISNEIYGRLFEGGLVYPKTKKVQIGPNYNGIKLPYLNVTTQAIASSQPRLYRIAEAAQKTPTALTFGQHDLSLGKLIALVPFTDELLQDKTQFQSYVMSQVMGQFAWQLDYECIYGTTASNSIAGILGADGANFVASPVAHAATPTVAMVNKIINAVTTQNGVRARAEWYMSGSAWAGYLAALGPGVASLPVPLAAENGGRRTLAGYPVNVVDGMIALNSAAKDVLFGDFSQFVIAEKGGITVDISKDFYFDTDQTCLRFVARNCGAPVRATYTAADSLVYGAFSTTS